MTSWHAATYPMATWWCTLLGALRQFLVGGEDKSLWAASPCCMNQVIMKQGAQQYMNTAPSLQPTLQRTNTMPVWRPYCKRRFGTNRGLQQHISIDRSCRKKEEPARWGVVPTQRPAATYLPLVPINDPKRARYDVWWWWFLIPFQS
jgi:hypothetical protein